MMNSIEAEIDATYNRILEICGKFEATLDSEGEEAELYAQFQGYYDTFTQTFQTVIICSAAGQFVQAENMANKYLEIYG